MIRVKICGNRTAKDALKAVEYGADGIGLLVGQKHNSPDFISPDEAKDIILQLPPFVSSVLVTHLSAPDEIVSLAKELGVTMIQLHGDTTPGEAKAIKEELPYIKLYKAIHVTGVEAIQNAETYADVVDAVILDTINVSTNQVGGTGQTHDWSISAQIVKGLSIPVILAGGLNPDNVVEAIKQVQPFAVDVNSGVKDADGYKDFEKLKSFIERAKGLS